MLKSTKGKSILKEIPLNRLLIETDGPFSKFSDRIVEPTQLKDMYMTFEKFYSIKGLEDIVCKNMIAIIR